jgi:hypothetical protein
MPACRKLVHRFESQVLSPELQGLLLGNSDEEKQRCPPYNSALLQIKNTSPLHPQKRIRRRSRIRIRIYGGV